MPANVLLSFELQLKTTGCCCQKHTPQVSGPERRSNLQCDGEGRPGCVRGMCLIRRGLLRGVPLRADVQGGAGAARGAAPDQQHCALVLQRAGGLRAVRGRHIDAQVAPVISCGGHYMVGLF